MIFNVSSSLSALMAFGKKMGVIANNVANVYSEGFKKSRANLEEGYNGGVSVEINRIETPGHSVTMEKYNEIIHKEGSNVYLAEEISQAQIIRRYYQADLQSIKIQDEMLGDFLDIMG
ncbi:MAG: flagellar basal body protein [Thermodesulfobacteriota bacterium]|nr:flagellar basal body protein [Thermodesulfobacteriota bacterium]